MNGGGVILLLAAGAAGYFFAKHYQRHSRRGATGGTAAATQQTPQNVEITEAAYNQGATEIAPAFGSDENTHGEEIIFLQ